ncbi:MAG TPA: hypothetical protein VLV45_14745 [Gemmatimonadales bacterium]|nr:hypothetical protein [Gemmatimonadales bacterium]
MKAELIVILAASACFSEPDRPAPPVLSITFDKPSVTSPGTLSGSITSSDPDGLDSIWLDLDSTRVKGWNGSFYTQFTTTFFVTTPPGLTHGTRMPVRITARDVTGFVGRLDTAVTVQ